MTEPEKTYIVTFRHDAEQPADWQKTLSGAPGVTLLAATGRHARLKAQPKAIASAISSLGEGVILEEEIPRYF